jgi:hypothetical protein
MPATKRRPNAEFSSLEHKHLSVASGRSETSPAGLRLAGAVARSWVPVWRQAGSVTRA